jgi:hypothetical protein
LAIVLSGLMLVGPIVVLVGLIFRCFQ